MEGVDSQNARLQYRNVENMFVTMRDESDLQDAMRCSTAVPNSDEIFRMCVRIHDDITPCRKQRRSSSERQQKR